MSAADELGLGDDVQRRGLPARPNEAPQGDRLSEPYEVRLAPAAERAYKKLPAPLREGIRTSLKQLATAAAGTGRIRGKKVKTIQGQADSFHRLRAGDYRVMYDQISEDRVLLYGRAGLRRDGHEGQSVRVTSPPACCQTTP